MDMKEQRRLMGLSPRYMAESADDPTDPQNSYRKRIAQKFSPMLHKELRSLMKNLKPLLPTAGQPWSNHMTKEEQGHVKKAYKALEMASKHLMNATYDMANESVEEPESDLD